MSLSTIMTRKRKAPPKKKQRQPVPSSSEEDTPEKDSSEEKSPEVPEERPHEVTATPIPQQIEQPVVPQFPIGPSRNDTYNNATESSGNEEEHRLLARSGAEALLAFNRKQAKTPTSFYSLFEKPVVGRRNGKEGLLFKCKQ